MPQNKFQVSGLVIQYQSIQAVCYQTFIEVDYGFMKPIPMCWPQMKNFRKSMYQPWCIIEKLRELKKKRKKKSSTSATERRLQVEENVIDSLKPSLHILKAQNTVYRHWVEKRHFMAESGRLWYVPWGLCETDERWVQFRAWLCLCQGDLDTDRISRGVMCSSASQHLEIFVRCLVAW